MAEYIELHCHSCFSFREGASTPLELILQARRLGYPTLALTDHDGLAGAMEFAQAAKEWDLKPIIGAEITLRGRGSPAIDRGRVGAHGSAPSGATAHLTLLASTPRGYANISRLLSMAHLSSPRGEPALDPDALVGRSEGIIALSGCRDGELSQHLAAYNIEATRAAAARYRDLFGRENFFIELQDNLVYGDRRRNRALVDIARELDLGVVATNNVHYHARERHRLQDVLVAVRNRTTLDASERLRRPNSEFYLKSPEEMASLFADLPEALRNTVAIAERCTPSVILSPSLRSRVNSAKDLLAPSDALTPTGESVPARHAERSEASSESSESSESRRSGDRNLSAVAEVATRAVPDVGPRETGFDLTRDLTYQFPDYESPDGRTADEFLEEVCFASARDLYGPITPDLEQRIRHELDLVRQAGQAGFFLRNWELMRYAHENDLPARGRGSSVGSLMCYLLGLSGIDPIKYKLFVGRFLNESRQKEDVPDIDLDFARHARERMFEHVFATYGTERAALVANVIQYRYPMAIRDVGKALGFPEAQIDKLAKRMRGRFAGSLLEEMRSLPEFKSRMNAPVWREFVRLVEELRGMPRHLSQHSGGVIISSTPIVEQVPVQPSAMDGRYICQWDKDSVADAGFIKMDFLGYPSLGHLYRSLALIEERHGKRIDPVRIPLDDPQVYEMIQRGDILGIVQIQSRAQLQAILRLKISCIEDLVVQVALIRPGPIQGGAVNPYILRSQGVEPVTYDHPCLEEVLGETKGVIIFQEQVLQVAMAVAGFTAGQAEQLRRAMSRKRSREEMEKLREAFLDGCRAEGLVDGEMAIRIYDKVLAFAEFGFPKAHAAAMAETAGKLAWVKRYYPLEFYCSWLNEWPFGFYSPGVIVNEARRNGIEVLGVDANRSRAECAIEPLENGGDAIRLGFNYVKGIGEAGRKRLEEEEAARDEGRGSRVEGSSNGSATPPRPERRAEREAVGAAREPPSHLAPSDVPAPHNGSAPARHEPFASLEGKLREGSSETEKTYAIDLGSPPPTEVGGIGASRDASPTYRSGARLCATTDEQYSSLWDFWRRTRLGREPIEHLVRLGAFEWTGLHERELLWQLGLFYRPLDKQLPLPLPYDAEMVALREMSGGDRVREDLRLTEGAVTTRGHVMDLASLHEGITPSFLVDRLEEGSKVSVAGFVAVRQAPQTAKGFVFHTLEDRYGLVNVITKPNLVRKYKALVADSGALIVHGHIERQERAVNVVTERIEALPLSGRVPEARTHTFG